MSLTRLAVPLPPMLPSLNQIGFDFYDLIVGTVDRTPPDARGEGSILLWALAARRDGRGVPVADPNGNAGLPALRPLPRRLADPSAPETSTSPSLSATYRCGAWSSAELAWDPTGECAGQSLYGEVTCADVPVYGAVLPLTGLCNRSGTLAASGTYLTTRYDPRGKANRRPAGVRLTALTLNRPRRFSRRLGGGRLALARGARYPVRSHRTSILLTDARTGAPVRLDYRRAARSIADARGDLRAVRLTIPARRASAGAPEGLRDDRRVRAGRADAVVRRAAGQPTAAPSAGAATGGRAARRWMRVSARAGKTATRLRASVHQ